jgi:hypothetical protein
VPSNKAETLSHLKAYFEILRSKITKEASKSSKLEQKIKITQQGYQIRADKLWKDLIASFASLDSASIEKGETSSSYTTLFDLSFIIIL